MRKGISLFIFPAMFLFAGNAASQINVAPSATVTASTCNTGPCSAFNDLNFGSCGTQDVWISTSSPPSATPGVNFIEWNWSSIQIFDEFIIHHAQSNARFLTGATIQYWDGNSWQNHHTFSNLPMQCINSVPFPVLATDRMRITSFQMTGSGQTSNPNFREIEIIQGATGATDDVGVVAIDSPNVFCPGTHDVVVTVQNFGTTQIDSVLIEWEVNGTPQTTFNYQGLIDTVTGTNPFQAQINLGSFTFTNAAYNVKAWTSLPNGNQDTLNINDTISATIQSNLPPPSNLAVTNAAPTTATFTWSGGSANSWLYSVVPAGNPVAGPGTSVVNPTATATGLSPATSYDFYVREVCPTGDTSAWAGPVTFYTLLQLNCGGGTTDAVFSEDWSSGQGAWTGNIGGGNNNWNVNSGTTTSGNTGPSSAHVGNNYIYFESSAGGSNNGNAAMVSPPIDLTQGVLEALLSFWIHGYGASIVGATLDVGVSTSASGPFTSVYSNTFTSQPQNSSAAPFSRETINLDAYIGQTIYLEFEYSNPNSFTSDLALDLIEVYTCNLPPSVNDAGVFSVDSPLVYCPGTEDVVVSVQNFGINQLDSVEVNWTVNGTPQPMVKYVGLIDTLNGANPSSVQVNLGSYTFTNAAYTIEAWTGNPNGVTDTVSANDSTSIVVQSNLPPPTGINVTNLTSSSVSFNWIPGSISNNFVYSVVPEGSQPGPGSFTTIDSATVSGLGLLMKYDIYVREVCGNGADTSAWSSPVTIQIPFTCPSNAYCFTTAGATGATGPTQAQVTAEYVGTNLDGTVTSNSGIQEWSVPFSGQYRITAAGAVGGVVPNNDPGNGALMSGEFILTGNQSLSILVGQQGESSTTTFHGGGGGGGSFVWDNNNNTLPLIAAGGGGAGGNGTSGVSPSIDATDSINGGANGNGTPGGVNGSGGGGGDSGSWGGGGGAGWNSDGLNDGTYGYGGSSPLNGGQGGPTTGSGQNAGGFGGGGSDGYDGGGGGGGYSGGRGGGWSGHTLRNGGGGGSYNAGTNQQNQGGINDGSGIVIIEPISFPAPNDAGIASIENPLDSVFCDTPEDIEVTIRNFGTDILDSAVVNISINNDTLPAFNFTGPLDTINGTGSTTAQITAGSYRFTQSGFYDIKVWTTLPNGQPDTVNVNDTSSMTVFVKLMDLQTTSVTEPLCSGDPTGSISVTSTAVNPTYLWFHGPQGNVVSGLPGGTYTVVVTGDFSCPDTLDIVINEPDPLNYNLVDGGSVSCNGDTDGSLEIEGDGGTPPYTYFWANGTPGNRIDNQPPGEYDVTITDSNNCEAELKIDIIDPDPLVINEDSVVHASCFGYNDGEIALSGTGGTTPYTWNWNTGDTIGVLANIVGGTTYDVTLVDANGCEDEADFTITQPDQLDTNLVNTHGSLLTANYNFGDALFEWWDCDLEQIVAGETNREFEPLDNGNFAMIITIDDCRDTSNCHVLNAVSTGDLTDEANNFTIYPNPNNGLFNVRLTGNGDTDTHLQIVDMQGKFLTDKKLGRIDGELVEEVNLNLAAGVYFVKVIRDGNLSVKRVIVQ